MWWTWEFRRQQVKRVVCVWLPMWPVDLARRRAAKQHEDVQGEKRWSHQTSNLVSAAMREIILVATKANQQLVAACCGQSRRAGVRPGMTVAHARALLKNPALADADPHGDRVALERLARWC